MNPIKEDLISEIIRVSQKNLLGKSREWGAADSEEHAAGVVGWIRKNAAIYRKHYHDLLEDRSATELGSILKELSESQKDLNDILENAPMFTPTPSES